MKHNLFATAVLATLVASTAPGRSEGTNYVFAIPQFIQNAQNMIGSPLQEWAVRFNNQSPIVLHRLLPQGAYFALSSDKRPAETIDDLRQRSPFVIFAATCPGSKHPDAKISSVNVWETLSGDELANAGVGLQQALEVMNNPPSIQTPGVMRGPSAKQLNGVVFEYRKGDTVETLSFIDEQLPTDARDMEGKHPGTGRETGKSVRLSYFISNPSVCPK